ncbi:MAG: prolipoprotein diacylglyceryl transferase [Anaerolineales bacterium]|nr:prolipoprotein diacylglyceryl transferase [Anaerolineales bacterium]
MGGKNLRRAREGRGIINGVIAFTLPGGFTVTVYTLCVAFGVTAGVIWAVLRGPRAEGQRTFDAALFALAGCLVGARLGYVAVNWGYFSQHVGEALQVSAGGLSWPGAFAGFALGALAYARLRGQAWSAWLERLVPLGVCLATFTWLGCWSAGVAYGRPATGMLGLPAYDEFGTLSQRFPVQLVGSVWAAMLPWMMEVIRRPGRAPGWLARPGNQVAAALGSFTLVMGALSLQRGDPAPAWLALRLETWAALLFTVLAALVIVLPRQAVGSEPAAPVHVQGEERAGP